MNPQTLLARYGSPAYVYDLSAVRDAHVALKSALPQPTALYYSLKANPHPAIVAELSRLGCRAEISSTQELSTALQSGCRPAWCLYTGPAKTTQEIDFALRCGVSQFSVDSPTDLHRVAAAAEAAGTPVQVVLRLNPDEPIPDLALAMTGRASQFGADASWVRCQPEAFASTPWARVVGFHIYTGTNITAPASVLHTFSIAVELAHELVGVLGIELRLVDLGGGFGHPFAARGERIDFSELRAPLEVLLDRRLPGWRQGQPEVAFESGRYLVAEAGTLWFTVQDVKQSKGQTFVVLDTGIHHLGGMAGLRRVPRIGAELLPDSAADTALRDTNIVGPLCTPLDYLAMGVDLPQLYPGTRVAIPNVGAYGLTASLLAFLVRETPIEIVLDGEEIKDVSQVVLTRSAKEKA